MSKKLAWVIFLLIFMISCSTNSKTRTYPDHWWAPIAGEKKSWEISPSSVKPPQVILSKRNELGLLSNFADTPFELDGKKFASLEGFWQATKFPENPQDPRWGMAKWPHSRQEVEKMVGFDAKRAGGFASKVMRKNNITWVSYKGKKMHYREKKKGPFYQLIRKATWAKLRHNPKVQKTLAATEGLELLPDHGQGSNPPPAWQYHKIYMEMRPEVIQNL